MKGLIRALAVVAVSTTHAGVVIHVDDDNCPGPGDGSEPDPYCSIQTAIDNAAGTDEILVAPGTYLEAIDFLGKAIRLHSADGPEVTIIDGTGNSHVVQCVSAEGPDTTLEGFTITGGEALGVYPDNEGGGMFNGPLSSPTVTGCLFTGNTANTGASMSNSLASPTVTDCTFSGNESLGIVGGAMANNVFSNAIVTGCSFIDNIATNGNGGAMHNSDSNPTVTDCTFSGNSSAERGAGMYNVYSNPVVADCTFSGSTCLSGCGITNLDSDPVVINCTFDGNSAEDYGGGMDNHFSNGATIDCIFVGNSCGISGGGMQNGSPGSPAVIGCVFIDNTAHFGGAMDNSGSTPTATNCIFTGNHALFGGGAMSNVAASPTITNCTFFDNDANDGGAIAAYTGVLGGPTASYPVLSNCVVWQNTDFQVFEQPDAEPASVVTIRYSDVQDGWPGIGNVDADPLFVDPGNDDLRLQAGSPCIDAGDNAAVPAGITTDFDGNPRFLDVPETPDTGNGELPVVDMGAYEALGDGCLAVTSQEIVCHADGTTFTVNVEGINACTGATTQVTFTGSGGAVGEQLCFTAIVNDGGFCCTTEICVTIPDCSKDLFDFLILLGIWE